MWYIEDSTLDPRQFIVGSETEFLHKLGNYHVLASPQINLKQLDSLARLAGLDMQRYFLVMAGFNGRMPDAKGEEKLLELLVLLQEGYEGRRTLGKEMVKQIDEVCLAYRDIVNYFKKRDLVTQP